MNKPRICLSVTPEEYKQFKQIISTVEPYEPDLIELRIDYLKKQEGLERIRDYTDLPLIATNRRKDQGGRASNSEHDRVNAILRACEAGFDYVDLELTTENLEQVIDDIRGYGVGVIVSYHDLYQTPSEKSLHQILNQEVKFDPDICKIVGCARTQLDNLTYLIFLVKKPKIDMVCFGMGDLGKISRVFSPLFGGVFTYASSSVGGKSAPGQLSITSLRKIYQIIGVEK